MCIIIEKKQGFTISSEWHNAFWSHNPDGIGIVYWPEGFGKPPSVKRSLDKNRAFQHLQAVGDDPAVVHYRMATHGETCKAMTHPFKIADGVYFIHNGIMEAPLHHDETYSDTASFAELVLQPLLASVPVQKRPDFVRSFAFRYLLEQHLGSGNRAVICDKHGWIVFNQQLWHTLPDNDKAGGLGGIRLSNTYAWANPYIPPMVYKAAEGWWLKPEATAATTNKTSTNVERIDWPHGSDIWEDVELTEAEAAQLPYSELADWVEGNPLEATDLLYDLLRGRDCPF